MSLPVVMAAFVLAAVCLYALGVRLVAATGRWLAASHSTFANRDLADLFIFIRPQLVSWLSAGTALLLLGAALLGGVSLFVALPVVPLAVILPRVTLRLLRKRRQRQLLAQLPDALALLAGLLRAGHGLSQCLAQLATNQSPPLGQELGLIVRKHRLGVPFDLALQEFAGRVPEPDVSLFVLAVRVSREVGGNLAESLLRLGEGIRGRMLLRERIDALTSQGKLQGLIIGLLPLVLMLALAVLDPAPMRLLFTTPIGWAILGLLVALEATGFLLIRRIVSIDL